MILLALVLVGDGCAFMQPHRRGDGAAVADTVGAILMGGTAIGVAAMYPANNQGASFSQDSGTTAAVATLAVLAVAYTASAIFGYTRDPSMEQYDAPILGLQMLALGLAALGGGLGGGSTLASWRSQADAQGCCSWHGGADSCYGGRVLCGDGSLSRSCTCW
jgi:predicted ribosomally synthesized peptide with SipW-like signal peptide